MLLQCHSTSRQMGERYTSNPAVACIVDADTVPTVIFIPVIGWVVGGCDAEVLHTTLAYLCGVAALQYVASSVGRVYGGGDGSVYAYLSIAYRCHHTCPMNVNIC